MKIEGEKTMKKLYRVWLDVPNTSIDSVYFEIGNIELLYDIVNYTFNEELMREVLYIDDIVDAKLFQKAVEELNFPEEAKYVLDFLVEKNYNFVLTWVMRYV